VLFDEQTVCAVDSSCASNQVCDVTHGVCVARGPSLDGGVVVDGGVAVDAGVSEDAGTVDAGVVDAGPVTVAKELWFIADTGTDIGLFRSADPGHDTPERVLAASVEAFGIARDTGLVVAAVDDVTHNDHSVDLWVVAGGASSEPTLLLDLPAGSGIGAVEVAPDGTRVAYAGTIGGPGNESFVIPTTVPAQGALVPVRVSTAATANSDVLSLVWSRDSRFIATLGQFGADSARELDVTDLDVNPPRFSRALARSDVNVSLTNAGVRGVPAWSQHHLVFVALANGDATPQLYEYDPFNSLHHVMQGTQRLTDGHAVSTCKGFAVSASGTVITASIDLEEPTHFSLFQFADGGGAPGRIYLPDAGRTPTFEAPWAAGQSVVVMPANFVDAGSVEPTSVQADGVVRSLVHVTNPEQLVLAPDDTVLAVTADGSGLNSGIALYLVDPLLADQTPTAFASDVVDVRWRVLP
jgi:hypothetical protein